MSIKCIVSHSKVELLALQDSRIQTMRHPAQVTAYIKEQQTMALAGVRGHQPYQALLSFYASMEHLCSVAGPLLNNISLSAIITATAQLWTSAQANSSFKPSANSAAFELNRFYYNILHQLQPMPSDVGAQSVSNILWSSAKLRLNPDAFVPGMTDALAAKLLQLTRGEGRRQPSAQSCAIFLWALATLGHQLADKGLVDAVCSRFAMHIKHHDESQRPNAQEAANVVWAVATLGHEPADKGLVDAVCKHFAMLTKHHDVFKRPSAQGAANVMWALGKMNHTPQASVAVDILEHFMVFCGLPRQAPNAQELSNILYACAMLRLKVTEHFQLALVDGLLRLDRSSGYKQDYCNAAWSLAVSGVLSSEMFLALLEHLQPLPTADPAHVALTSQDLSQLYQALDFLHPLPMAAAQQLQEMVARLGPFPLPDERSAADLSSNEHLCAALGQLGLAFSANVPLSGYQAAAVLQPRDSVTVPVVLVTKAVDHFRNQHHRCVFFLCPLYITAMYG